MKNRRKKKYAKIYRNQQFGIKLKKKKKRIRFIKTTTKYLNISDVHDINDVRKRRAKILVSQELHETKQELIKLDLINDEEKQEIKINEEKIINKKHHFSGTITLSLACTNLFKLQHYLHIDPCIVIYEKIGKEWIKIDETKE